MGRRRGRHIAPRPRSRRWLAIGAVASVVLAGGLLFSIPTTFASAGSAPSLTPTPTPTLQFDKALATGPDKVVAPVAEPVYNTVQSPLTMEDPYPDFVPDQCPEGTVAGTVDANGNQSNCQPVVPSSPAP